MRRNIKFLLLSVFFTSIIFISCTKEYFNTDKMRQEQWQNVDMQVPIINTSLVLRDLLKDYDHEELFEIDDEGLLSLMYNQTVFSEYAKNLIVLSDIVLPNDNLPGNSISGTNIIINNNFNFSSFPGAQLDSIAYHNVDIEVTVSHNMPTEGALTVQFPGMRKNGNMAQLLVANSGTTTHTFTGYALDLATNGPNSLDYSYVFNGWSGTSTQSVNIAISIKNQEYRIINGYIGKHALTLPEDSVYVDIFNKKFDGQFYFEDPKIKLTILNSYGLPIRLALDSIYGKNYDDVYSQIYHLGFDKNPVNYPTVKGNIEKDEELFDSQSLPWLKEFIATKPKYIFFDGEGEINPDVIQNNFVLDTSVFTLNMEFQLPLWLRAEYPTLQDTSELEMGKHFKKLTDINYLKFRLDINNGMATEVRIQTYFVDSLGVIQDSLFMNKEDWVVIDGGITDADGKVIQKNRKITEIVYEKDRINKLETVTDVVYVAEIRTDGIEEGKLVKFYASDAIDIKMGIHLKGGTNFDFSGYEDDTTSSN